MRFRERRALSVAVALLIIICAPALCQEVTYIYDPLGRLIAVVDLEGRTTMYDYDAVGNLLSTRRPDIAAELEITFVNPSIGAAGTQVEIFGVGFRNAASENQVTFNGVSAPVLAASPTRLTTQVPIGATTGPITVTTPAASAVSPDPFRVPRLTVSPLHASVAVEKTRRFTVTFIDSPEKRGLWSVDGIEGGNDTVGTITPDGLYLAPAEVPDPPTRRIRVTSFQFPILFAEADITIGPPVAFVTSAPSDVRVVRPGVGDPGGLALNLTAAGPFAIRLARPGLGDVGGLSSNVTVAGPPHVVATRPGTGDSTGLEINVIVGAPASVTVVRPATGGPEGEASNVTVARPHDIKVQRQ
jgi:YD repeat-containing protein